MTTTPATTITTTPTVMPNATYKYSEDELLAEAHEHMLGQIAPAIVYTVVLAVLGIFPNILTVIFYGYKCKNTPTNTFITALAGTDLLVSVLVFAYVIELMNIYYISGVGCKLIYFFAHCGVMLSVGILWLIAIDRYRRLCKPLSCQQISTKSAKICVGILVCITLVTSVRDFWTYDAVAVNVTVRMNDSVIGRYCTNTNAAELQMVVVIFHVADSLVTVVILVTFGFTYGNIWWSLRKHRTRNFSTSSDSSGTNNTANRASLNTYAAEKSISVMMFVVSVGFVVCFTPYYVAVILKMASPNSEFELEPWFQFLFRTPVFNSIINPVIYCVFNPHYRRFVKTILCCGRTRTDPGASIDS